MPQSKSNNKNWLINPRVPPPNTAIRLDNSAAKIENNYLDVRLKNDIDELDTRKLRKKADQQHVLKIAKKDARSVLAQAQGLQRDKGSASDAVDGLTHEKSDAKKRKSIIDESLSDELDDSVDISSRATSSRPSNADRIRPSTTSVTFRLPVGGSTSVSSIESRAMSGKRPIRPKSVGPMTANAGGGQKSYQHLKDMVENDSRKRLQETDIRTKIMLAINEKRREDEEKLQMRLQRFYTDLDQFIKQTKYPSEFRTSNIPEISPNFLMQLDNLRKGNE